MKVGIGQDSHRFLPEDSTKPCKICGLIFEEVPGFKANSDGDVVFHAVTNALSSISGEIILGRVADDLLQKDGITDSAVYLQEAKKNLGKGWQISHVSVTIEGLRPKFLPRILEMRQSLAKALSVLAADVGITATTGEGLTDFGCGDGVAAIAIVTAALS